MEVKKLKKHFENFFHSTIVDYLGKLDLNTKSIRNFYFKNGQITSENKENIIDIMSDINFMLGIHRVVKIQIEKNS